MAINKKVNITRAQKIRDAGKTPLQKAQTHQEIFPSEPSRAHSISIARP